MAHTCALDAGGQTLAIVGSGLLDPYPAANKKLFDRMVAEGGALVSSFPLATVAHPGNFPARNRIIAGMSHACLVVQAAARSGALITATYALEQGKDILAVPGMINDPLSEGCHALIREGAFLAASAQDILSVFGEMGDLAVAGSVVPSSDSKQQLDLLQHAEGLEKGVARLSVLLVRACVQPRALDELSFELEVSLEELMQELFELQLAGKIHQNFAGLWQTR
jgi:DNA processing protein